MKKRITGLHRGTAILLAAVMAFGLTACGNQAEKSSSAGKTATASSEETGGAKAAEGAKAAGGTKIAEGSKAAEETKAAAAEWRPEKTINIIVPFSAGGDTDFNAREYANFLSDVLHTNVIVTNVTGGGGSIASQQVKDSDPDGYTVLFHTTTFLFNQASGVTDYGLDDFELSCVAGKSAGWCIAVRSDSPYNTLEEMVQASQNTDITLASGSGGVSSSADCIGSQLLAAGAKVRPVEFGGASDKVTGLLGGEVDAIVVPLITAAPYLESGDFKGICVFEQERSKYFPDIPTAAEEGYDAVNPNYYIMMFPKGTPEEIVNTFTGACEKVYQMEEYKTALVESFSQEPYFESGDQARRSLDEFCNMIKEVQTLVGE